MSRKRRSLIPVAITVVLAAFGAAACGNGTSTASSATDTGAAVTEGVASQPATSASPSPTRSTPRPSAPSPTGTPGVFVFPVVGKVSYGHTHHDYPATDILTACGNEVRAATSGVILEVTRVDTWKASVDAGATRGGLSVSIKGDDGLRFYGSHMEEINTNIKPGVRVAAGEPLGKVGRTGDASACHLHFGISPVCSGTGDWWNQRGVIWPWPYLDSWRSGGHKSPVAEIDTWQAKHGCPTKPLTDP